MDRMSLSVTARKEFGKVASKRLRAQGILPAVVYDSKGVSTPVSVSEKEFTKVWKQATPTTLIELDVDGKKNLAFIKDTRYDIISDRNLHVDFHAIDEQKPLKATIKVQTAGNPVGVRQGGVFASNAISIQVECLPQNLPVRVVANVDELKLDEEIRVKDLALGEGVKVLSDMEAVVASVKKA